MSRGLRRRGAAMMQFAIAIPVFAALVLGVFGVGRQVIHSVQATPAQGPAVQPHSAPQFALNR